jgi:predicted aldo/keto reductase-like oxidoreductase
MRHVAERFAGARVMAGTCTTGFRQRLAHRAIRYMVDTLGRDAKMFASDASELRRRQVLYVELLVLDAMAEGGWDEIEEFFTFEYIDREKAGMRIK